MLTTQSYKHKLEFNNKYILDKNVVEYTNQMIQVVKNLIQSAETQE